MRTFCRFLFGLAVLLPAAALAQGQGPIQQVGFSRHGRGAHHGYPNAGCQNGYCPPVTFEYVPSHNEQRNGEHLQAMGEAARQLWYRLEYLHWNIKDPGDGLLGARRLSGNEAGPFDAVDPVDAVASGFATEPNASQFDLDDNSGIRFSIGATTRLGDVEADVWVLNQSDDSIVIDPVRRFDLQGDPLDNTIPNFFAATVLTVDGALSDTTMLLYDQGYRATLKTDVFGTQANFVFNPLTPNQPLIFRPLVGFQYVNYREDLLIAGMDQQADPVDPTQTITLDHRISSKATNNMYAPQIGFRAEFIHESFTIGVTPKFLLGFNRRQDELSTSQLFFLDDSSFDRHESTEFSPGFDLKVDARVHLNEHFSIFAAYQLYVLSNISRPVDNVNYDTIGGVVPNLTLKETAEDQLWFDGVTVGCELRFH